jgi:hypothetical protein
VDSILQDQILTNIAKQMQEQIDLDIMMDILDWTKIEIDRFIDNYHAIDIREWLEKNCTGAYKAYGRNFYFQNEKDAVWFSLKWM